MDTVIWVKTTIDIADALLQDAKQLAAERKTTLKAVIEDSLREFLPKQRQAKRRFRLRDASFRGKGLQPGVREGDWQTIRDLIYEGRGV